MEERRTAQAAVQDLNATETEWEASIGGDQSGHTATFSFAADGRTYVDTLTQVTWYKPGTQYKVCYNPSDPRDASLYPPDHVCGQ